MKKVFFIIIGLSLFFSSPAQNLWDNGKLVVSDNNRYLQFENGTPFFWLGDTGWLMPQKLDRSKVGYYLSKCRRAGYNMIQVQVLNGVPSINSYGQLSNPFGWDMMKADPDGVYSYWDHMDYIIDTAARNGIFIGMVTIWGGQVKNGNLNVEQAKEYGRFLAQRYKDKPNIIWIMGGDIPGDIHPEVWDALATTIKSIDKNHLMTYHPRGRYTSAKWFNKSSWMDFHMYQSGHRRYGQRMGNTDYPIPDNTEENVWMYVDSTWNYKPQKPVVDGEPSYEAIPIGLHDPDEGRWKDYDVRRYAYWDVFAGCFGHTYGHNSIMQMLEAGQNTGYGRDGEEKSWIDALEDPGFNQMKYLKDLILTFPFFERIPDQSIISGKNGIKYDRLIATRGNSYLLVYNYHSNHMTIDLKKISGSKKNVWWMDAATGKLDYLGVYDNGIMNYTPLNTTDKIVDGVLIAVDAMKNYINVDQKQVGDQSLADKKRNLNE